MARAKVSLPTQTLLTAEEEALRIDVFWEALKNHTLEIVAEAFKIAYIDLRWFPTPNHIIEIIQGLEGRKFQRHEAGEQIEWMNATEEGKAIAKRYLSEIFDKLLPKGGLRLGGTKAEEFERKREIAKSKAEKLIQKR